MALYTETLLIPARKQGPFARLRAFFASKPLEDQDISKLTDRELVDMGVKRSRDGLFLAELRDIDRLGLGWRRLDRR
ncbi:MAG TPA: hypothetical protein VMF90_19985 [Rhizobiaceae bacterium]|nr:hypothetical protein [Rhizobiaceae bacterium]